VLGVDDVLLAVVRPRMRPRGAQLDLLGRRQHEQSPAQLALCGPGRGHVLAAAGPDLDLGRDQLTGDGGGEHGIVGGGVAQLLEAAHEAQADGIE
jgi:hypothetical protein